MKSLDEWTDEIAERIAKRSKPEVPVAPALAPSLGDVWRSFNCMTCADTGMIRYPPQENKPPAPCPRCVKMEARRQEAIKAQNDGVPPAGVWAIACGLHTREEVDEIAWRIFNDTANSANRP